MKENRVRALIGSAAGFLNGLFGSGGGALVVPASERFLDLDAKEAHASAIAVMLPMSVVSAVMYTARTKPEPVPVLLVSAGGLIGGWLGAYLLPKLPNNMLRKAFGVFIVTAAIKMIL